TFFSATSAAGLGAMTFNDNFQTDLGWGVTNSAGLTTGTWERGVPITDCSRGNPTVDADGSGQCYLTGNNNAGGTCDSDVDGGSTTLTSPNMDASQGVPLLSYARWYNNHGAAGSTQDDTFVIDYSFNGGSTWTNLETIGPTTGDVNGGWITK